CGPTFDCWALGANELGINTKMCTTYDPSDPDLTAFEWFFQQALAYTFEVRVFDTLTMQQRSDILDFMARQKPARSKGILRDALVLDDFLLTIPVTNIDRFDNVDTAAKDAGSETGYSGRLRDV
ncbi:MAG: hypothetical protein R3330_14760, partial [Saprospiraceae bacterium]|nr:hypothetical protein [Saprospiraceae bacterium]